MPQPFELSKGVSSEVKRNKMMKELKERQMSEYTFKPNTNEGRNRRIIQEILEEADKENTQELDNI